MKYNKLIFALSTISSVHAMELDLYPRSHPSADNQSPTLTEDCSDFPQISSNYTIKSHSSTCRDSSWEVAGYPNFSVPEHYSEMRGGHLKSAGDRLNSVAAPTDIPENYSEMRGDNFVHAMGVDSRRKSYAKKSRSSSELVEDYLNSLNTHIESEGSLEQYVKAETSSLESSINKEKKPEKLSTLSRMSFAHAMVMHFPPEKCFNMYKKNIFEFLRLHRKAPINREDIIEKSEFFKSFQSLISRNENQKQISREQGGVIADKIIEEVLKAELDLVTEKIIRKLLDSK